jgi:hypothetical protein
MVDTSGGEDNDNGVGVDVVDERSYVLTLIHDLALSRSDCISAQKRNELLKIASNFLAEKSVCRSAFADHGKGTLFI